MNKTISNGKWLRLFDFDQHSYFTIKTDRFIIHITGGSIVISDRITGAKPKQIKGYNYLYTGDVKPDETEIFALENGKHFYVISLEDFTQKLKITLPRFYEAIDVYGSFSSDGNILYVPVQRWRNNNYEYCLCEYETKSYSLVNMKKSIIRKLHIGIYLFDDA